MKGIGDLYENIMTSCSDWYPLNVQTSSEGEVRWWNSLLLFFGIAMTNFCFFGLSNPYQEDLMSSIQPVLDLATKEMPPYNELIKTICGGEIERPCYRCQKTVIIRQIFSPSLGPKFACLLPEFDGMAFFAERLRTICTGCLEKDKDMVISEYLSSSKNNRFQECGASCHNCFQSCINRLRCMKCQSKLYCSEECRTEDFEDHNIFCDLIHEEAEEGETGRRISKREVDRVREENTKGLMETN